MNPLVSVVIPAYNRAHTIEEALKSIQAQTYANWEVIVSDDGSKDDTVAVVKKMMAQDSRLRLVQQGQNQGAQAARNAGIKAANGEWIAFLDSDDRWLPESLARRMNIAEKEKMSVVHSNAYIMHPDKSMENYYIPAWSGWIYKKVLTREGPMFQALLVRKEALERIGYLDESIKAYQEWETSIRLAKLYPFGFEPQPTFIYDYRTTDAISRNNIRNGQGYEQIVTKHFLEIVRHVGLGALAYHYEVMADWYRQGGDLGKAKKYALRGFILKCLSPGRVLSKVKHVVLKKPVEKVTP